MVLPNLKLETSLIPSGTRYLLAIDEVGRGPWAGPVTVAGCLFDLQSFPLSRLYRYHLRDSKLLTARQRRTLVARHLAQLNHFLVSKDNRFIDTHGLSSALTLSIAEIINHFSVADFLLIDGNYRLPVPLRYRSVIAGDRSCATIAAASILAKVHRDTLMTDLAKLYPQYGFDRHKGYGTQLHQQALVQFGPCPLHRLSCKPVQDFLR
ncbi:ribonuclease HII [Patescibacteria group bacterium]|nr:ribonuclease HII [Patescibacteria group bacterium]